ncbi:MAG: prolyl oligopeptidase family serine peptidase [Desulfobacterales bacterium]
MANGNIHTERFTLVSEGLRLKGFWARPRDAAGPLATVQVHHGGGGYETVYEDMAVEYAREGMVGVTLIHRGYAGSEGEMEYGKGEIRDIKNLTDKLIEQPFVDPLRLGIMGYSRGGHNAVLAIEHIGRFAAGALWSTPVDMRELIRSVPWVSRIIGGSCDDIPHEYDIRSSINYVDKITCPLLILHGEQDDVVSVEHAVRLARALEARHKPYELTLFPGEGHNWTLRGFENNRRMTTAFFKRCLRVEG